MENKIFELIQEALLSKKSKSEVLKEYKSLQEKFVESDFSKYSSVKRLLISFYFYEENKNYFFEFLVNLRQVVLILKKRIYLKKEYKDLLDNLKVKIDIEYYLINDLLEVNFNKKYPQWIGNEENINELYNYERRRSVLLNAIGDNFLFKYTGFKSYTSKTQKLITKAMGDQAPGSTILAVMPTGGGKSLPMYLTALADNKGITVVIVPIIALAIDQYKSSKKYFEKVGKKVGYYSNDLSEYEKEELYKELKEGKMSLVFLSPESVLNGKFNNILSNLAKKQLINRIIIDEAHVISDWGEFFRTEFQLMAIFRKRLMDLSKKQLKTVLFSATVSEKTEKVLKFLFSEKENFIQIRGDSLRDEITYYTANSNSRDGRIEKLKEILMYLPRPLIIYVSHIEYGKNILKELLNMGFVSVRLFTSETKSDIKKSILNDWNSDNLDIIIATSAFGMGVDKKDVRAVIHTFIPENIDRFYQEVGRVGRDGYQSLSLTLTHMSEDEDIIKYLTRSKVLTAEKIVERWIEILNSYTERLSGDEYWISIDAIPENLKETKTGQRNMTWNEYVILFLYREGLLNILEVKQEHNKNNNHVKYFHIKLLRYDILSNKEKLLVFLTPIRERERSFVDTDIHLVKSMIQNKKNCWGIYFEKVYRFSEKKCMGCPNCRAKKKRKVLGENNFEIKEGKEIIQKSILKNEKQQEYCLLIDSIKNLEKIASDYKIDALVLNKEEFGNLEEFYALNLDGLKHIYFYDYKDFFSMEFEENMIVGNIAFLYTNNNKLNTKLYKTILKFNDKKRLSSILHLTREKVIIEGYNKDLIEIIDGNVLDYRRK